MPFSSRFLLGITLPLLLLQFATAQSTTVPYEQFLGDLVKYDRSVKAKGSGEYLWVVHFWASHNTPSRQQIASLQKLYKAYSNRPVRIVSVSIDKVNNNWKLALRQHDMPWAQTRVPREADYDFLKSAFRHNSLPALYIIDKKAKVRRIEGNEQLTEYLESNLGKGKPVTSTRPDTKPKPDNTSSGSSGEWVTHTVKSGDTLYSLFRKYGVSVDEIKKLNKLTSNTISVGQKLKIKRK
jgi:thiol-disulfide isomerase/thioredoxin